MKRFTAAVRKWCEKLLDFIGRFRLLTTFLIILVVALVLFSFYLLLPNHIAKSLIRQEYQEYNETILNQAEAALNLSINDLTQLCYTFMSNKSLVDYAEDETFIGRSMKMDEVKSEFNRLIALQDDIKAIYLYDRGGKMIASAGAKHYSASFQSVDGITFSGLIQNDYVSYFSVTIPVFDVSNVRNARKISYCQLMVSLSFIEQNMDKVLPNEDYFCLIVDNDGYTMLQKGDAPPEIVNSEYTSAEERRAIADKQVLYQATLSGAPWRILFGVPQKQLYSSVNLLQQSYFAMCFILGLLLVVLFIAVYASVLRPIHSQIVFMNYYAKNRTSRMTVSSHNEMGELAMHLNHMLDDIDRLTAENVKAQQQVLEAEYQMKQSELFAYRNQINPHFLRNTFECIRGMALYHNMDDIAAITESLSDLFSYNLLGKGYAPVKDIKSHIDDYTSIIRYRFNNRYSVSASIDTDAEDVNFPKMVVQPLVENAIFHGLETVETGGSVTVLICRSEDKSRLLVTVEDNGLGMTAEELDALRGELREYDRTNDFPMRKHGIGIINVYRRLRLFYLDTLEFSIHSVSGKGTVVNISVPCNMRAMEENYVSGIFDR